MLYPISRDAVELMRTTIIASTNERMLWELEHNHVASDLESITRYLTRFIKRVERCDAFSLGYFATHAADFANVFTSHRVSNACYNVYAMPKALIVGRVLNGSALDLDNSDDETIAGVVLAMQRGVRNSKALGFALNDFMCRDHKRVGYASGGTQSSSALRALEALGIVRETGRQGTAKLWDIADSERFQRVYDAACGIAASRDDDDSTIDGTCEHVPEMTAVPTPSVPVHETEGQGESVAPLALPAPKAKRVRPSRAKGVKSAA